MSFDTVEVWRSRLGLDHPRNSALYLRSVSVSSIVFRGLRCHPLTCMLLKIRLTDEFESYPRSHSFNGLALFALCLRSVHLESKLSNFATRSSHLVHYNVSINVECGENPTAPERWRPLPCAPAYVVSGAARCPASARSASTGRGGASRVP
jgi:hypothetical protein